MYAAQRLDFAQLAAFTPARAMPGDRAPCFRARRYPHADGHHLADIVLSLRAFEEYNEACESLSPEDAALHHYLWRRAAQARALFEDAIERVAEAEGIPLEG